MPGTGAVPFRHLRRCYGCGPANPASLGITHRTSPDGVEARIRFGVQHQGAPGLVHGGLLATLLDEAMGTVPVVSPGIRLTTEMTVRYLRPTPIDTDLVCRAHVVESSKRAFSVVGAISAADASDVVLVEGSAIYVLRA
jgi:uncharacterized protein (TIGR00369 family)